METLRTVICAHNLDITLTAGSIIASSSTGHSTGHTIISALLTHTSNVRISRDASSCIVDIDRAGRGVRICAALASASDEGCRAVARSADGVIGRGAGEAGIKAPNNGSC